MKQGLTLIEVVIGIALASIMTIILYRSLAQTRASVSRTDRVIDYNAMLAVAYNQLNKDITGMVSMVKTTTKKSNNFASTAENTLSFITTNALAAYHKNPIRPVRVVYRLKKTPSGTSSLTRQEGDWKLDVKDFDATNKFPAYELMGGITKLSGRFYVPKNEPDQWSVFTKWTEEEQNAAKISLPKFIELEGSWIDTQENREYPFTFSFFIPVDEKPKQEPKKPINSASPNFPGKPLNQPLQPRGRPA